MPSLSLLCSVEWYSDCWMMNWKCCGKENAWHGMMYCCAVCVKRSKKQQNTSV